MVTPLRDRLFQTDAILLGRQELGEADRIFVVFTPHRGKLSVLAKGVRRPQSRLGANLDLFASVHLELARGRDLDIVTGVTPIAAHHALRTDLDAYGFASYFAELVRNLTQDRQDQPRVYALLESSLAALTQDIDPWPIVRHFEIALLSCLGYHPELFRCVNCRNELLPAINTFSAQRGGMMCPECRRVDPTGVALSVNAQKFLRTMLRSGLGTVIRLNVSGEERQEITAATSQYVRFIAERDFSSLKVLAGMQIAPVRPAQPGS